jgi:hypothetical protein
MSEAALTENIRDACQALRLDRWHTYDSRRSPAGWVDEVIAGPHGVLFRELKTETGRVTEAQQKCLEALTAGGLNAGVWRPRDWVSGRIVAELTEVSALGVARAGR